MLVVIWSSTWVAIKLGLEDVPPLLSAGVRFALAGAGLLVLARLQNRSLRTDVRLAAVVGGGLLLLAGSGASETWAGVQWTAQAIGSNLYLVVATAPRASEVPTSDAAALRARIGRILRRRRRGRARCGGRPRFDGERIEVELGAPREAVPLSRP